MSNAIKPCPFCGLESPWLEDIETASGVRQYVYCHACGAMGGRRVDSSGAIEAWNRRSDNSWMADEYELDHGTITAVVIGGTRYVREGA